MCVFKYPSAKVHRSDLVGGLGGSEEPPTFNSDVSCKNDFFSSFLFCLIFILFLAKMKYHAPFCTIWEAQQVGKASVYPHIFVIVTGW